MSKPYIAIGYRTSKVNTKETKEEVWAFGNTPTNARVNLMRMYRDVTGIYTQWTTHEERRKYRDG